MPFFAFTNSCYFTLRAGGQTIITFVFDSLYQWTIVVPLAFVLSRFTAMPIVPMYFTVQCMELIKCVLGYYFLKKRKWVRDLVNG
jgi:Na+-driven multidrug efflux pump